MRRISGLVLAASLLLPVSLAHAAEVTQLYTNNLFASAVTTDEAGHSIGVFVTREKGKGAPRDSIFVIFSDTFGNSTSIRGTLPKNALRITAKKASLDVDIDDIDVIEESGTLPDGVISVDWAATDVTRTSGGSKIQFGNTTVSFVGTSTSSPANISGSVLGNALVAPTGDISLAHTSVIIHVSNNL
jgi:hypothetical protein